MCVHVFLSFQKEIDVLTIYHPVKKYNPQTRNSAVRTLEEKSPLKYIKNIYLGLILRHAFQ